MRNKDSIRSYFIENLKETNRNNFKKVDIIKPLDPVESLNEKFYRKEHFIGGKKRVRQLSTEHSYK